MPPSRSPSIARRLLFALALAALCAAPRLWLWSNYAPASYPDSGAYFDVARQIAALDFSRYSGARTPGYSFLLLLAGLDPHAVRWLQTVLGIATALLVYALVHNRTSSPSLALAAGAVFGLAPDVLFLESALLTEAQTAFLVILAVAPLLRLGQGARPAVRWLLFASLAALLAALTRPQYAVIAPVVLLLLFQRQARLGRPWRERLSPLAVYGGPWALSLLAFFGFNYVTVGSFGPSTLLGFHLMNHAGRFVEAAPDEFADFKEIYIPIRDQYIAENNTPLGSIYAARDELQQATGLSQAQLSDRLTQMALAAIVREPGQYLQSVSRTWLTAWRPRIYWAEPSFASPDALSFAVRVWLAVRPVLHATRLLFLAAAAGWLALRALRGRPDPLAGSLAGIVFLGTAVQALVESGGGSRYVVPFAPLMASVIGIVLWQAGRWAGAGWRSPRRRAWFAALHSAGRVWVLAFGKWCALLAAAGRAWVQDFGGSRRLLAVAGLALCLAVPSLETVARYLGVPGALAYMAVVVAGILGGVRYGLPWLLQRWPARLAPRLAAATFLALVAVLVWVYPVADSAVPGRGSDRDDALDLAAQALLQGRYPYAERTYLDNPIGPLPGAVLLAAPFVLLGGSAYQNVFWLFAFFLAAALYLRDARLALLLIWAVLLLASGAAHEFITGGDYLANSIYVCLAALLALRVAQPGRFRWPAVAAAAFLGVSLASRANFWLVLPLLASALARRAGWRSSLACLGVAALASAAITLPFYVPDPAAFTPALLLNRFPQYEALLPRAGLWVPGAAALLALALSLSRGRAGAGCLLRNMAFVQGLLVLGGLILGSVLARRVDFAGASFGLAFLFPGVLGAALIGLPPAPPRPAST